MANARERAKAHACGTVRGLGADFTFQHSGPGKQYSQATQP